MLKKNFPSLALVSLALAALVAACGGGGGGGSSFSGGGGGGGVTPGPTSTATPSPTPTTTGPVIVTSQAPQSTCPTPAPQATAASSGGVVASPNSISFQSAPGNGQVTVSESGSIGPFRATIGDPTIASVDNQSTSTRSAGSAGGQVTFSITMTCNGNTTLSIVDTSHGGASAVVPISLTVISGIIF